MDVVLIFLVSICVQKENKTLLDFAEFRKKIKCFCSASLGSRLQQARAEAHGCVSWFRDLKTNNFLQLLCNIPLLFEKEYKRWKKKSYVKLM